MPIVAIVGRANVGKSSLFNAILDRREAIVAREAGTTRDSIFAKANYKGQQFWIVDTAGLKDPEDDFEESIQFQIRQASDSADIIMVVTEADVPPTEEDRQVAKLALRSQKPLLLVVNKIDKAGPEAAAEFAKLGIKEMLLTSVTQSLGINDLLDSIIAGIQRVPLSADDGMLRIALLGRPNVGKSALFNALLNKQQAVVSSRAGTTRDVNRARVRYQNQEIELMDTAGIRRPGKIERGVEQFSVLRSLAAIEQADLCFLLIDSGEPIVQLDQKIAGMVKQAGRGLVLVLSKWDLIENKDEDSFTKIQREITEAYDFVYFAPLILTSSETGQNVTRLYELALKIKEARDIRAGTKNLNDWLGKAIREHPPAGVKNHNPKLNYIVQEEDNPIPAFKIFGSQTKFIHFSYRRYLERSLRERFGFYGNPVQLWFIEKHEHHPHGVKPKAKQETE